jgi:segregation and condensation protein B
MSMDDQSSAEAKASEESDLKEAEAEGVESEEESVPAGEAAPVAANDEGEPQSDLIEAKEETEEAAEGVEEAIEYELDEEHVRMTEALLFAASEPLDIKTLADRMPEGIHITTVLEAVQKRYEGHGVHLIKVANKWAFRTAPDLSFMMEKERIEQRRLSRAAIETLAIVAYHQPVTRAEIEAIRGVSVSKGTIDVLMEVGWVKLKGRRRVPGRPVTYGTNDEFLDHFGLDTVKDLPGLEELKAAGLLDARLPPGFGVPSPDDTLPADLDDEDDDDQEDLFGGDIAAPFDDGGDEVDET